jgi:GNAT superfamily N-acetyltransferase
MSNSKETDLSFNLRPFRSEDSSHVFRLVESVLAEFGFGHGGHDDDWDMENISAFYAPPESVFLVLESGSDIVGTVGVKHRSDVEVELRRMYLRHDLRGHGHGKVLLSAALDFARSQGCESIYLRTLCKLRLCPVRKTRRA